MFQIHHVIDNYECTNMLASVLQFENARKDVENAMLCLNQHILRSPGRDYNNICIYTHTTHDLWVPD
jgi:hypothetical protein